MEYEVTLEELSRKKAEKEEVQSQRNFMKLHLIALKRGFKKLSQFFMILPLGVLIFFSWRKELVVVVAVLDFSVKTQNKPSKTSEEELIRILKRLAKPRGNSHI